MSSIQPKTVTVRSGRQITIRTAKAEDAAALLAYIRPLAAETEFFVLEPDEFPATEEQEPNWIQDHFDHPGQIVLLAKAFGTIIGNVSFENGPCRRIAHRGTLGIAVVNPWRGRGIGTALMECLLEWATGNPLIEKVCLESSPRIPMQFDCTGNSVSWKKDCGPGHKFGPGNYVDTAAMCRFVK